MVGPSGRSAYSSYVRRIGRSTRGKQSFSFIRNVDLDVVAGGKLRLVAEIEGVGVLMAVPIMAIEGHIDPDLCPHVSENLVQAGENLIKLDRLDQCKVKIFRNAVILEPATA